MNEATSQSMSRCATIPIFLGPHETDALRFITMKLGAVSGDVVEPAFAQRLAETGRVAIFIDGFTERDPEVQAKLRNMHSTFLPRFVFVNARLPVDFLRHATAIVEPMPLDSSTLLYFLTALLAQHRGAASEQLDNMEWQLDLGSRLARLISVGDMRVPLTPLLVKLYVSRALALLEEGRSLDELPLSIPEAYFEYIRTVVASEERSTGELTLILRTAKVLSQLALEADFVPKPVEYEACAKHLADLSPEAEGAIQKLTAAGILIRTDSGLSTTLRFALDPLAEYVGAYSYLESYGNDSAKLSALLRRVDECGVAAQGFRAALQIVLRTRESRLVAKAS
jgi:hypothetical protein